MKNDLLFFCIHHHTFGHTIPSLPTDCHITNNELGAQMMCLCIIWAMRYVIIISFLFFLCFSNLVLHQILSFSTPPPASTPSHAFDRYYALLSIYTSFHGEHPFPNTCTCFQLPAHVFHPSDTSFNRNTHSQPSRTAFTCSHTLPSICDHSQPLSIVFDGANTFLNVHTQFHIILLIFDYSGHPVPLLRLQTIKAIVDSRSFKSPKSDEPRRVQVLDLYCLTRFESEGSSKGIVYKRLAEE